MIGIGQGERRVDAHLHRFEYVLLDEAADHRVADPADHREFADQPLPVADPLQCLSALLGHAIGHGAGGPIFDDRPRALQRRHGRQRHAQHGGGGAQIIIRRPFDQPAQRFGQGRGVHHLQQIAQAIVADAFDVGKAILLPHDADDLPRP